MITTAVRNYIATALVDWFRDPNISQEFVEWTPRSIRDQILHMVPASEISEPVARRIANGLTRWMGNEDGYIKVRHQRDHVAFSAIARVIEISAEDKSAGRDDDIVDDLTASTYPNLMEWIEYIRLNLREFAREQRRIGTRPKKAKEMMLRMAAGSIEDALLECC